MPAIRITEKQKEKLDEMKVHPNQPYHEVMDKLLEKWETEGE